MHHLINHRSNQVMIISGESGSGKTETAKHILHFATAIANLNNPFAASKSKVCTF
jgi:myosin heavy subunit